MGLLLTGAGDLMAKDVVKTKMLMLPLPWSSLLKFVFRNPRLLRTSRRVWSNEGLLFMEDSHVREHLNKL